MNPFHYQNNQLYCENLSLEAIATEYGTPCYVYSKNAIQENYLAHQRAFDTHKHLIAFAVKANSNLAVLNLLAKLGSGFDIVSGGELLRVLAAGGDPQKVVFSGVAKTTAEIILGLQHNILCFNVESLAELERINKLAGKMGKKAPISIRINPDVDAKSHPYISTGMKENKFGLSIPTALEAFKRAQQLPNINIVGIDYHIGSQLTSLEPFIAAYERAEKLIKQIEQLGITLAHIDVGGGLGITYKDEHPPTPQEWIHSLLQCMKDRAETIIIEPGRSIVGNTGILLTRIEYLKQNEDKHFAIVDAGMNDLLRPALYEAWHDILPVKQSNLPETTFDIAGPVCESSDRFGENRLLNSQQGDLLTITNAGAYGFQMASNYNTRPRAAEVWVDGDQAHLIRKRETLESLFAEEHIPS